MFGRGRPPFRGGPGPFRGGMRGPSAQTGILPVPRGPTPGILPTPRRPGSGLSHHRFSAGPRGPAPVESVPTGLGGPAGPRGPPGPRALAGPRGPVGSRRPAGPRVLAGPRAPPGPRVPTGPRGPVLAAPSGLAAPRRPGFQRPGFSLQRALKPQRGPGSPFLGDSTVRRPLLQTPRLQTEAVKRPASQVQSAVYSPSPAKKMAASATASAKPAQASDASSKPAQASDASSKPVQASNASSKPVHASDASLKPAPASDASAKPVPAAAASAKPVPTDASSEPAAASDTNSKLVPSSSTSAKPVTAAAKQTDSKAETENICASSSSTGTKKTCDLCRCDLPNEEAYDKHLQEPMHKERLAFKEKLNRSKAEKAKVAVEKVNPELGVEKKFGAKITPRRTPATNSTTNSPTTAAINMETKVTAATPQKTMTQPQRNFAATTPRTNTFVEGKTVTSKSVNQKSEKPETPSSTSSKSAPTGQITRKDSAKTTTSANNKPSVNSKGEESGNVEITGGDVKKYCPDYEVTLPSLEAYSKHTQSIMHENKVASKKRPDRGQCGRGLGSSGSDSRDSRYSDSGEKQHSDSRDSQHSDSRDSWYSDSRDNRHIDYRDSQRIGSSASMQQAPNRIGSRTPTTQTQADTRCMNSIPGLQAQSGNRGLALRNRPQGPTVSEDQQYCTACDISLPSHKAFLKHVGGILHQERAGVRSHTDRQKDFTKSSPSSQNLLRNFSGRFDTSKAGGVASGQREGYPDKISNYCSLCDVHFQTQETYVKHTKGLMHLQKVKATESAEVKPFAKISYEDFLEGRGKGDAGKKRKAEEDKKFFCTLCSTQLISGNTFKAHMERLHHRTGLLPTPGEDERASEKVSRPSCLKTFVQQSSEALIGLNYVTEYQHPTHDTIPTFQCRLCDLSCDYNSIKPHVVSYKHRVLYFKKHEPMIADEVKRLAGMKPGQVPNLEHFAREVESRVGKGQVAVKIDEKLSDSKASEPKQSRPNPSYDRYDNSSPTGNPRYDRYNDTSGGNKQRYDRYDSRPPAETQRYDAYDNRSTLDKQRYDPYYGRSTADRERYDNFDDRSMGDGQSYDPYYGSTVDKQIYGLLDSRNTAEKQRHVPYDDRSAMGKQKYDPYDDRSAMGKQKYDPYDDRSAMGKQKYDPYDDRSAMGKQKYDPYDDRSTLGKQKYDLYDERSVMGRQKYDPYNDRSTISKQKYDPYGDRAPVESHTYSHYDNIAPAEGQRADDYDDRSSADRGRYDMYDDKHSYDRRSPVSRPPHDSYVRREPANRSQYDHYDNRAQYDDRCDSGADKAWVRTDLRSTDQYMTSDRLGQDLSQISEKTLAIQKENELLKAILEAAKSSTSKGITSHSADRFPAAMATSSSWDENSHLSREATGAEAYDPFEPTSPGAESLGSHSKRDNSSSCYSYSPSQQPTSDYYRYGQHAQPQNSRPGLFGQMDRDQRSSYGMQDQGTDNQDQQQQRHEASSGAQHYNTQPDQTDRNRGHYYDARGHQQGHQQSHYDVRRQYDARGRQQPEYRQQQLHSDTRGQQQMSYNSPMSNYRQGIPTDYQGSSSAASGNGGRGSMMSTVSGGMVSSEEDAVALQVSSTLTQALLQYKIQSSSGEGNPGLPDLATLKERMSQLHDKSESKVLSVHHVLP